MRWVLVFLAGCDVYLSPLDAARDDAGRVLAGSWTRTALPGIGSYNNRYAAAFAVDAAGNPTAITGESYQNGSFYESNVMGFTPSGSTWAKQYLANHQWSTSLGASVAADTLSDGTFCAAWSRPYDGDLTLSCGAASAYLDNVGAYHQVSIAVDAADGVHLAWPAGSSVKVRAPDGTVSTAMTSPWDLGGVELAVGPDGLPVLAVEVRPTPGAREIQLLERRADGTWAKTVLHAVASGASTSYPDALAVAVSPAGKVAVGYGVTGTNQTLVWEEGTTWTVGSWYFPAGVALAYVGEALHGAWVDASQLRVGVLDGGAWTSEVVGSASYELPGGVDDNLHLAVDGAGTPHLLSKSGATVWIWERSGPMVEQVPPTRTVAELAHGDLVITEFLANPAAVSDDVGEWVEIHNPGPAPIDLAGLVIEDDALHQGVIEDSVVIAPGAHALLGRRDATLFAPADLAPVAFYGYEPALNNSGGDRVRLLGPQGLIDESYRFGTSEAASGRSWQLDAGVLDAVGNDDPASWCGSTTPYTGGDRGTPGEPNDDC